MDRYYIVDAKIVPDVLKKVVEARMLLQNQSVKKISEAVKQVGISRATYYKYKDYVFKAQHEFGVRKAIVLLKLDHQSGILSQVLDLMSSISTNIITIHQNIPIHNIASVVISFDFANMEISMEELIAKILSIPGVLDAQLEAIE